MKRQVFISIFAIVVLVLACSVAGIKTKQAESETVETETVETGAVEAEAVGDKPGGDVLVTVNGVDITEEAVDKAIEPQMRRLAAQSQKLPPAFIEQQRQRLYQQILDGLIVQELLNQKSEAKGIQISDTEVQQKISEIASQQGISMDEFKAILESSGKDMSAVAADIKKGMRYEKLLGQQWEGKLDINPEDANKYYNENTERFARPEQVEASHILIKVDSEIADANQAGEQAKQKAQDVLKLVRDGGDFDKLAREYSEGPSSQDGGKLGYFSQGQMVKSFEQAAFALEPNEVSDIVESQFGYHIIKVTDRKEASTITFEEAKEQIIEMLSSQKKMEIASDYIESLKEKAKIVYSSSDSESEASSEPASKENEK